MLMFRPSRQDSRPLVLRGAQRRSTVAGRGDQDRNIGSLIVHGPPQPEVLLSYPTAVISQNCLHLECGLVREKSQTGFYRHRE